jgi:hypothetical protein
MKITCIYPEYPECINGVMRFVKNLYFPQSPEKEIDIIGIWFDEYYKHKEEVIRAHTLEEKQKIKEKLINNISAINPNLLYLKTFAIDKELI